MSLASEQKKNNIDLKVVNSLFTKINKGNTTEPTLSKYLSS